MLIAKHKLIVLMVHVRTTYFKVFTARHIVLHQFPFNMWQLTSIVYYYHRLQSKSYTIYAIISQWFNLQLSALIVWALPYQEEKNSNSTNRLAGKTATDIQYTNRLAEKTATVQTDQRKKRQQIYNTNRPAEKTATVQTDQRKKTATDIQYKPTSGKNGNR